MAQKHDKNGDGRFTQDELPEGPVRQRFTQMDLDKDGIVTPNDLKAVFASVGKQNSAKDLN